jgi:hypothetical protein
LPFAGKIPFIRSDYNSGLIARIWANEGDVFLWCINRRPYPQEAVLELNEGYFSFSRAETIRGGEAQSEGRYLRFALPERDAAVYRLV